MGDIGTTAAAAVLGVSAPTVRKWLGLGVLTGHLVDVGDRQVWRLDADEVAAYADQRAQATGSQLTLQNLAVRLAALETGDARPSATAAGSTVSGVDALTLRAVVAEQAAADEARATVIKYLLAALEASEVADTHRRAAITAAETALGHKLVPDDPSSVTDTAGR